MTGRPTTSRPRRRTRPHLAVAAVLATAALAAGCAPGGGGGGGGGNEEVSADQVDTDISDNGDVTLTVWDQEVRGGQAAQIEELNAAFEEQYPNVTIDRTSRATEDLERTLGNALTSDDPPDVVQVNNNRSNMGEYVGSGLLQPLDGYAEAYGWDERFPESIRSLASYSEDGADFGDGNLYGLAQVGEMVGVWYSKPKLEELGLEVPTTTADFEQALQAAAEAGETPIQFGNLDGWPGIHDYGFVHNQFVPREEIRALGFGLEGGDWTDEANVAAADAFTSWVDEGYFTEGFNGLGYDAAWQDFAKGEGVFLVAGTWLQADLDESMGEDVGFFLPPVGDTGELAVTGGTGIPFAVAGGTDEPDVAAAYLDFITNEQAMQKVQSTGNLPVVGGLPEDAEGVGQEVLEAWNQVGEEDALVPYLDYATPDFYDLLTAQVQEVSNGSTDPEEFLQTLQDEYSSFTSEG